eukprot:TRINITY_DN4982_c0_g1_i2.p1 TRINITY_DN4982_c0_g1~~TRINITY_DN4982_c0_g1_i2.p1  ORF type:complete len:211 (+),score=51.19 TRINITY_DN4982_c0_g1_i2:43-675(+)
MNMDLQLASKHVFITGAAGGIGVGTAAAFLEQGANVSLQYHSQFDSLAGLVDRYNLPDQEPRVKLLQADARDEDSVIKSIQDAVATFGVIHVIVINHAIATAENINIADMSLQQWNNTLSVNLTGVFLFAREFVKQMRDHLETQDEIAIKQHHASVIIIGSTAGKFGEAGHIDYASSKSALMYGFTRTLKNEMVDIAPRATVTCLAPGYH